MENDFDFLIILALNDAPKLIILQLENIPLVGALNLFSESFEFILFRQVDEIRMFNTLESTLLGSLPRQLVDLHELGCFGHRCTGHPESFRYI